jgi:Domain of unknown function (DUF4253)
MEVLRTLGADLIAEIPPGDRYADAARGWLDGVLTDVFPDLLQGLRSDAVTKPVHRQFDTGPLGEPGQLMGELLVGVTNPLPRRTVLFTETAWRRMLRSLDKSPLTASLYVRPLGQDGYPSDDGAHIEVKRSLFEPEWVRFTFTAPVSFNWHRYPKEEPGPGGGWPSSAALQDRWAGFVQEQAARIGVCAGSMTDDTVPGGETALEEAVSAFVQHHNYRKTLYGYSWITIVPAGPAARLGGVSGLAAIGAFCEVAELPDRQVWLRATPTINEFTGERVRGVFEALAPVMLRGRTKFVFGQKHWPPRLVEGVNAADYQEKAPRPKRPPRSQRQACSEPAPAAIHDKAASPAMPVVLQNLPSGLPHGQIVVPDPQYARHTSAHPVTTPVMWVSDQPVPDARRTWARLLTEHPATRLWPLLLAAHDGPPDGPARPWHSGELAPGPESPTTENGADSILAEGWHLLTGENVDFGPDADPALPFPRWPGLAPPAEEAENTISRAASVATETDISDLTGRTDQPYLGLVPAPDGATAITASGWLAPSGEPAKDSAVIKSWQNRFGAQLISLGLDTLVLIVTRPPRSLEHARHVAAEHFAFCHDLTDMLPFDQYAQQLIDNPTWGFWWD